MKKCNLLNLKVKVVRRDIRTQKQPNKKNIGVIYDTSSVEAQSQLSN